MEPGLRSPLVDLFRRGEATRDVCLLAAQGALAPRAHEQLALLMLLSDSSDTEVARAATATIANLPAAALTAFLARTDVPAEMRAFFSSRATGTTAAPAASANAPLVDAGEDAALEADGAAESEEDEAKVLSSLPIADRLKLAMKGTREQRAQLVRDPNKIICTAVLSSPKLTEAEVEAFTKMGNVSEDVLRIIGMNRTWLKNYSVILGLTKNPKTPPAMSMQLMNRLTEKDVKMLTVDRNVPESLRLAARRMLIKSNKK
jgi:hypothetical protein